ncbi:MAG: tripartite tricarboxylate transporter substrate binding protein, partial [Proteobacteria bacterium]|nr:tripartite tricarboxylate transporter substrate binding protein [Pseudomonadota bacterium]
LGLGVSGMARRAALFTLAAAATSVMLLPGTAQAAWPERPITVVVMYGAGGGTDKVLRVITAEMAKATGWTINVINKPGAVGGVATSYVLGKADDGYTWLGAANYNKFVRVMGHSKSKAWEDWQYMKAANSIGSWSVRADSPFKNMADIIAAAKKDPGKISISTSGTGGIWHELAATAALSAGITLKYVPYKGGKPATLAGLQGETDIAGGGVHEHIDLIRAGKLRHIQQTGDADIVDATAGTLSSIGKFVPSVKPLLPMGGIYNLAIRRSTPIDILQKIEKAFVAAANSDAFKAVAKKQYFTLDVRTGKEADKNAAQMEVLTAETFSKLGIKGSLPASKLGLPTPAGFDKWWPPQGYKPRM